MALKNVQLRLETYGGSAGREYRVNEGRVEVRSLQSTRHLRLSERLWHRLSSQQLSIHVERNTVVAQWLERRLGWRKLLQACVSPEMQSWIPAENHGSLAHGGHPAR